MRFSKEFPAKYGKCICTNDYSLVVPPCCGLCLAERKMPREYARRKFEGHVLFVPAFFNSEPETRLSKNFLAPWRSGSKYYFLHWR
jgi:hypothetical protein